MSDIRPIADRAGTGADTATYERLLGTIGSQRFGPTVRDSVVSLIGGVRRIYLFEATGIRDTSLQYYHGEPGITELFPAYLKSYLRLDPVSEAYRAAPNFADMALQRVRPSHIASSGFRRRVFDDGGIVERISIIQRGPRSWRVMSVARHSTDGCLRPDEIDALIRLSRLVLPMVPVNRARGRTPAELSVAEIEERFADRFTSLTPRERQVCARAVLGMSVEATALALGIAKTSVLTYRRRAYARLRVSSPYELCALVTR